MHRALLVILLTAIAAFAEPARAEGIGDVYNLSPFWKWKQLESEHFRLTFPEELTATAERAVNDLEEANAAMAPFLYWQPDYKTPILLIDNADSANGVTSALGRFGIVLYVTPPDDWFSTAYYDDWLRLLCFHEYTHFLNMDAARGFWATGRKLFGDVLLPNSAWPSWMLEGLAVYDETRFTGAGRGRSPYYDAILRSAVEAGVLDTSRFYTLDRINSTSVPYFPGGEAYYLFGYELMNEVARRNPLGDDALGKMSYRSSWRIPWFINGNLENITGHDWYWYWDQLIQETAKRAGEELARIRAFPVTQLEPITHDTVSVLGSSSSPDGRWIAYTGDTLDERYGLFIEDRSTGEIHRADNKISGAQISFTPDSRYIILSSLRREGPYANFSELGAYSMEKHSIQWLTSRKRARDPNVSPDGTSVVFTMTSGPKVSVAIASIARRADGGLELKNISELVPADELDAMSSPKFSSDGKIVYFTLHRNGRAQEDLMAFDLGARKLRALVSDGHFNRFPAVGPDGSLYFVSDKTGVDNIYRYREGAEPELFTNVTSGIAFPSVSKTGEVFGDILTYSGWRLVRVEPLSKPVPAGAVTIAAPPAPAPYERTPPPARRYAVEDYSIFPSIWPRAWIPYGYVAPSNVIFGDVITGFDAVDRHRYLLDIGYDTLSDALDWLAEYQNRSLGATLTLLAGDQFSYAEYAGTGVAYYARDEVFSFGVSFANFWTYSSLTPSLALTFDQTSYYFPNQPAPFFKTQYLPDLDLVLSYSNTTRSRLSIVPEHGRNFVIGGRYYISNGNGTGAVKGLLGDVEYIRLGKSHAVLSPSVVASYASVNPATNPNLNSDVILQGYYPLFWEGPFLAGVNGYPGTSLNRLSLRGYPYATFFEKAAVTPALDFYFPISDVFRGWGTDPVFLDQIYGAAFVTAAYLPYHGPAILPILPAAGGGLIANLELLVQLPISLSVQYQYGFQPQAFGVGDLIVDVGYSGSFF